MAEIASVSVGVEVDTASLDRAAKAASRLDLQLAQLSRTAASHPVQSLTASSDESIERVVEAVIEERIDTLGERLANAFERATQGASAGAAVGRLLGPQFAVPGSAIGLTVGGVSGAFQPEIERIGEAAVLMAEGFEDLVTTDAEEAREGLERIDRQLRRVDREYAKVADRHNVTAQSYRNSLTTWEEILLKQQAEMAEIAGIDLTATTPERLRSLQNARPQRKPALPDAEPRIKGRVVASAPLIFETEPGAIFQPRSKPEPPEAEPGIRFQPQRKPEQPPRPIEVTRLELDSLGEEAAVRGALIEAMQAEAQQRLALVEVPGARSGRAGESLGEAALMQTELTDAQEAALPTVSTLTEASTRHALALGEVAGALAMVDAGEEHFADTLARAGIATDTMNDTLALTEAAARQMGGAFAGAFEDVVFGGESARAVVSALAADIQRTLTRSLITQPLSNFLGGAASDFVGAAFGGALPFFHQGGVVDPDRLPHFQSGGFVGVVPRPLQPDELLGVLHKGETVRTREQEMALQKGLGGAVNLTINVTPTPGFTANQARETGNQIGRQAAMHLSLLQQRGVV